MRRAGSNWAALLVMASFMAGLPAAGNWNGGHRNGRAWASEMGAPESAQRGGGTEMDLAQPQPQSQPQSQPHEHHSDTLKVITYTRAYCAELSARVAQLREEVNSPNEEAALLSGEGDRLCATGQIRSGIIRLRRAIMLLRAQPRTVR